MMESELAWNPFKRKAPNKAKPAEPTASASVVKPMAREAPRRTVEASNSPRFKSTASGQVSGRGADRFALVRTRLRETFTPSQPIADRRFFAGREEVLNTIIRSIEDQRLHVVIYGERGIGKTSMLHVLTQAAKDARYIVVYTSCGANSKFDETFRAVAADIPLLFHSGYSPTATESEKGASLADLLPAEPLTPRKFGDLAAKLTGTRVLVILDEFDRVDSAAFRRDIAELIKNLSDRLGRVQVVLAGVAADLSDLVEHIPSIRRNIFALRVPKMSEAEVLQIISTGEREADLKFDAGARASVVTVAHGSPYLASLLCHHASYSAIDEERNTVLPSDVARAVALAVAEFQSRIPKPVQANVRRLFATGRAEIMALAARAALALDGSFSDEDLSATGEVTRRKADEVINTLVLENVLKESPDAEGCFTFIEDGLPTLIWMLWAQMNLEQEHRPAKAAAVAT
jgi:Cdc6-like AAA superfamily ATPase